MTRDGVPVDPLGSLALVPLAAAAALSGDREPVLLGVEPDGGARFAVELDPGAGAVDPAALAAALAPASLIGLRDAAARLPAAEAGLAAYATALLGWHRGHGFCANCGTPTRVGEAGHVRTCPTCGAHHHPRTDPVVIMLVVDEQEDRVLLGRQPSWPERRYSALAGFVEPGEPLEAAVAREVREEAGVEVARPRYVASQPWPFPGSLMLGFVAVYAGGEAHAADGELADARWFGRAEVADADAVAGRGPLDLPPRLAIARRLLEGWLAGATP